MELVEIRWHGRGGQGAKTIAQLFAEAVISEGVYVQAFPEYGPERTGAPVKSFNRISNKPITLHCAVESPDYVVVLDDHLLETVSVAEGMKPTSVLLVNTKMSPEEVRNKLKLGEKIKIYTIDADKISLETIGKKIPNTPMMGALVKVMGNISIDSVLANVRERLEKKFRHKPEVITGNIESIKRAYNEIK
jgi:pyruvate ferredoxin oxidoreductase gamma subunit